MRDQPSSTTAAAWLRRSTAGQCQAIGFADLRPDIGERPAPSLAASFANESNPFRLLTWNGPVARHALAGHVDRISGHALWCEHSRAGCSFDFAHLDLGSRFLAALAITIFKAMLEGLAIMSWINDDRLGSI